MFILPEVQEIQVLGGMGGTCHPFPGERELHFSVWETLPFLLRACKRGFVVAQSKDLDLSDQG